MKATTPAMDLDFYCEAIGRALVNTQKLTGKEVEQAVAGLADKLMGLKGEDSLSHCFERRVAGVAKLIPQTQAFADVRNTLALQAA